jgi:hypothetical protein
LGSSKLVFTLLLPALAISCWVLIVVWPVAIFMYQVRHALEGMGPPQLGYREFVVSPRFWDVVGMALDRASWQAERTLVVLNGPARWVDLVVSRWIGHRGLMPWSWIAVSYPFFAMPAWGFVGWGLDGLAGRVSVGWKTAAVSVLLVMAAGIWLGEARVWMILFGAPALAWWRFRVRN